MDTAHVARVLGGEVAGRNRILCPGPGHSSADRSLSVRLDPAAPNGFKVHSFASDRWQVCRDHVLQRLGLRSSTSLSGASRDQPVPAKAASTTELARRLWAQGQPIGGSLVERYLQSRGIILSGVLLDGEVLRFHSGCPFRLDSGELTRLPAMLAAMVDIRIGTFCGVHRTALQADGSDKADVPGLGNPKKMLGSAKGTCVKLSADDEVTTGLHIAEGIETALACMSMGFVPMWAALSAGGIEDFPVLCGIEALTIFADHDASGTGLAAARACARRWAAAGCEVRIRTPPAVDSDWADDEGGEP